MGEFPFPLPLLLDGATGTMLQAAGMPAGACTEAYLLDRPEALAFQSLYVREAGAQAVYAPTFGANRVKLAPHGLGDRVAEVNRRLVSLCREQAGPETLVGGDLSPLGLFAPPVGETPLEELVEIYREQALALEEAQVDFFVIETMLQAPELRAALLAVREVSHKPVFVTVTCDSRGRTVTGLDVRCALLMAQSMGAAAFGLNCSTGPRDMLAAMELLTPFSKVPLLAKPNAGLPQMEGDRAVFSMAPREFVSYTVDFARLGVGLFGGCCGTTPEHLRALGEALKSAAPAAPAGDGEWCCTERLWFSPEGRNFSQELLCGEDLEEELPDWEEDEVCLILRDLEGVEALERAQYGLGVPFCLEAEEEQVLEQALRRFHGRACCRGAFDSDFRDKMSRVYGAYWVK